MKFGSMFVKPGPFSNPDTFDAEGLRAALPKLAESLIEKS